MPWPRPRHGTGVEPCRHGHVWLRAVPAHGTTKQAVPPADLAIYSSHGAREVEHDLLLRMTWPTTHELPTNLAASHSTLANSSARPGQEPSSTRNHERVLQDCIQESKSNSRTTTPGAHARHTRRRGEIIPNNFLVRSRTGGPEDLTRMVGLDGDEAGRRPSTTRISKIFGGQFYFRRLGATAENKHIIFGGSFRPPKIMLLFSAASTGRRK